MEPQNNQQQYGQPLVDPHAQPQAYNPMQVPGGAPAMGYGGAPPMGQPGQPMMGQPGQPMMGQPGQPPMMGQPGMSPGQTQMGNPYGQPPMGQPGQPMMGQPGQQMQSPGQPPMMQQQMGAPPGVGPAYQVCLGQTQPVQCTCPNCHQVVVTNVVSTMSSNQIVLCILLFIFICPLGFIPLLCCESMNTRIHTCGKSNFQISREN